MCKPALVTAAFSTIAFLTGAITSLISGFLGMKIATYANARTALEARKGIGKAFTTAFRSGVAMGFLLAANGQLVLYITINLFKLYYGDDWEGLFEAITGYGLGGSSMALFERTRIEPNMDTSTNIQSNTIFCSCSFILKMGMFLFVHVHSSV
ncbi:putative inorganic diphosphatase [Helianthus annuus]|uniref:H(+)-exporting diphosphatase n=1 Tax=Helianthus annuus TaxID=4232 RepID=A0A9K3N8T4_HELAN|nr:putative inorganic diphosphatase [Helianthus annuus]KAJ0893475.1 putative inorganic diphosphatase [Helianthus annuus]